MTKKLVSEIIEIKTNTLDAYVSKYFNAHLQDKKNMLMRFKNHKAFLKIEPCMWALIFALDGQLFDELIIDEYSYYEVVKDLRYISATYELESCVSNESLIRIALSKEFKCIYQFTPFRILDALLLADLKLEDEIISAFKGIVETQMYLGKPIFKNFSLTYIDREMDLLKSILRSSKVLTLPPTLIFYALHDFIYANICLENHGYENATLQTDINTIFSDENVRSNFVKVPGLLTSGIRNIEKETFDTHFTFDEILQSIKSGSYFECKTSTLKVLISYIYDRYPNRFDELENTFLDYIKNDSFYVEYHSIIHLMLLEQELRKFKNSQIFKDTIIDLPIAYDLFCDFKERKSLFRIGLKSILRKYNVEFDYIVNLVAQVIDDECEEDIAEFQSFKNLLK